MCSAIWYHVLSIVDVANSRMTSTFRITSVLRSRYLSSNIPDVRSVSLSCRSSNNREWSAVLCRLFHLPSLSSSTSASPHASQNYGGVEGEHYCRFGLLAASCVIHLFVGRPQHFTCEHLTSSNPILLYSAKWNLLELHIYLQHPHESLLTCALSLHHSPLILHHGRNTAVSGR